MDVTATIRPEIVKGHGKEAIGQRKYGKGQGKEDRGQVKADNGQGKEVRKRR